MLTHYVERHRRIAFKLMLHDDEELASPRDNLANPVAIAPTLRSETAKPKAAHHRTDDNLPAHRLRTMLLDFATLTYNVASIPINAEAKIFITRHATPVQAKAYPSWALTPLASGVDTYRFKKFPIKALARPSRQTSP